MKLTKGTREILGNFADINQRLHFPIGRVIRTQSPEKTIFASAQLDTEIEREFRIYDLRRFLFTLSLLDDSRKKEPSDLEVDANEERVLLSKGKTQISYSCAGPREVPDVPERTAGPSEELASFFLPSSVIRDVVKAARVLRVKQIMIQADGKIMRLVVGDMENKIKDCYAFELKETDQSFSVVIQIDNFMILATDYTVQVFSRDLGEGKIKGVVSFHSMITPHIDYVISADRASRWK